MCNETVQTIIVWVIIAGVLFCAVRRMVRLLRNKDKCCGSCANCPLKERTCPVREREGVELPGLRRDSCGDKK